NNDGRVDLVVANFREPSLLYVNTGNSLGTTPSNITDDAFHTTSMALGLIATPWTNEKNTSLFYFGGFDTQPDTVVRNGVTLTNVPTKADLVNSSQWFYDADTQRVYLFGDPTTDLVHITTDGVTITTPTLSLVLGNDREPSRVYRLDNVA